MTNTEITAGLRQMADDMDFAMAPAGYYADEIALLGRAADLIDSMPAGWQPIETAPKDRPILAWCDHEADPYFEEDSGRLTLYGGHVEVMSHAPTGYHIVEWGGAYEDSWEDGGAHMPDWWFVAGSDFECAANPTHWMPLPAPPIKEES